MPIDTSVVKIRISEVRETISELLRLTSKIYDKLAIDERYSIRYNIIVLVEALVSLCTHIARKRYNYMPKYYADAVRFVSEKLNVTCVNDLVALVKLRNILVNRYWNVDDREVYDSIKRDFKCVEELLRAIGRIIEE